MKTESRKHLRNQMLGFEEVVSITLRIEGLELIGTEFSDDSHGVCVSLKVRQTVYNEYLSRVFIQFQKKKMKISTLYIVSQTPSVTSHRDVILILVIAYPAYALNDGPIINHEWATFLS